MKEHLLDLQVRANNYLKVSPNLKNKILQKYI